MPLKLLRVSYGSKRPVVAGVDIENSRVTQTAPILRWALNMTEDEFRQECRRRAFVVEDVPLKAKSPSEEQ